MQRPKVVWTAIDTLILNIKGELPSALGDELDELKRAAQDAEDDVPSPWRAPPRTF